jgi:hypothetical protein
MKKWHLSLLFTLCAAQIQGQINTDRPSLSDNSYVLPLGAFQNENGFRINFIQNNTQPNTPTRYTGLLPFSSFRLFALSPWLPDC